jgi:hypothetical protein
MTKHDSWVILREGSPFDQIKYLFPNGFPVRDPFPLEVGDAGNKNVPIFAIDIDRLDSNQLAKLALLIAANNKVSIEEITRYIVSTGYLGIASHWVKKLWCGDEGIARQVELADFFEKNEDDETFIEFYDRQYRDWIDGDKIAPKINSIDDVDPRLRTPELENHFKNA